jgi:hypothetical protein
VTKETAVNEHHLDTHPPVPATGQNVSRTVFEYHYLRRRLLELHSADERDMAAIDAVMRKLDEMRSAVRAAQPPLDARAPAHTPVPARARR